MVFLLFWKIWESQKSNINHEVLHFQIWIFDSYFCRDSEWVSQKATFFCRSNTSKTFFLGPTKTWSQLLCFRYIHCCNRVFVYSCFQTWECEVGPSDLALNYIFKLIRGCLLFLDFQISKFSSNEQLRRVCILLVLQALDGWLLFFFWDPNWVTHLDKDGRWGVETERLLEQMCIHMLQKQWNIISVTFRWWKVNIC